AAGFTPSEADALRRSMATFKMTGGVHRFRDKLIEGMVARGYSQDFAERTFRQIEGFGSYGFPESHAASFALIAYASSWMKCHHPEVFACALLNAQPMGFYAPAQIVRDAREHGVTVRPPCVNASRWDCTLEAEAACQPEAGCQPEKGARLALRLGLRMAKGLANADAGHIIAVRGARTFGSVEEVWRRSGVPVAALARLAEADGFRGLGLDRRAALWAVRGLRDAPLPLFAAADRGLAAPEIVEPAVPLAPMGEGREVVEDYRSIGLSLRRHPVAFLRGELDAMRMCPAGELAAVRDGGRVAIAGLVLVRQRPGSAKGVLFITIEDETGQANLIVWPDVFERYRRLVLSASMIACHGRLQREGIVTHVVVERLVDLSALLRSVGERTGDFPLPHGRGDEARHNGGPDPRERIGRKPRDIYVPDLPRKPVPDGAEIRVRTRDFR
ncbi:MAG TPA: OB-fold nucleic acid binding domain-containing protein, partial [Acetobacteraceae bacterium]|nr:OB-fold nucleic acid binding domain-containing protein [Acetobacteraceae bacterium]